MRNNGELAKLADLYGMTIPDLEMVLPVVAYYPSDWRKVLAGEMVPIVRHMAEAR